MATDQVQAGKDRANDTGTDVSVEDNLGTERLEAGPKVETPVTAQVTDLEITGADTDPAKAVTDTPAAASTVPDLTIESKPDALYTVKSGDNLWNIASGYLKDARSKAEGEEAGKPVTNQEINALVNSIFEANKGTEPNQIKNPDLIYPGQELKIPGYGEPEPEPIPEPVKEEPAAAVEDPAKEDPAAAVEDPAKKDPNDAAVADPAAVTTDGVDPAAATTDGVDPATVAKDAVDPAATVTDNATDPAAVVTNPDSVDKSATPDAVLTVDPNTVIKGDMTGDPVPLPGDTVNNPPAEANTEAVPEIKAAPLTAADLIAPPGSADNPTVGGDVANNEASTLLKHWDAIAKADPERVTASEVNGYVASTENLSADDKKWLSSAAGHMDLMQDLSSPGTGADRTGIDLYARTEREFELEGAAKAYMNKNFDQIQHDGRITAFDMEQYHNKRQAEGASQIELDVIKAGGELARDSVQDTGNALGLTRDDNDQDTVKIGIDAARPRVYIESEPGRGDFYVRTDLHPEATV